MKTLLIAIAKIENNYLREWVEYHKRVGFDNIILCDNNDIDGERFDEVIGDYIRSGYVIVEDYRGKEHPQIEAYNTCYRKYNNDYDWLAFFDIDEYFTIATPPFTMEMYLSQNHFNNAKMIKFNWLCYGDNDITEVDYNTPVTRRFLKPVEPVNFKKSYENIPENAHCKMILHGGLTNVNFITPHNAIYDKIEGSIYDSEGKPLKDNTPFKPIMYRGAYIRHYATMTAYEYAQRLKKGDAMRIVDKEEIFERAKRFFALNKRTEEKEQAFKDVLGIDVSEQSMKSKDVKLFMLCYDKEKYDFVDNAVMTPIQCGAARGVNVCRLKDNTGDNLSSSNFFYVENTGTYWIWKNVHGAKYKGQTQYRRRLKGVDETMDYDKIFQDYDIICAKPYNYPENHSAFIPSDTVEGGYEYSHCLDDLLDLEEIIKTVHPDYADDYDKYIKNGQNLYYSNGFVLPAEEYDKYCEFLFDLLGRWLGKNGIRRYEDVIVHVARNMGAGKYIRYKMEGQDPMKLPWGSVNWQIHIGGFLSERILTLYIYHNFPRRYEVEYEKMEEGMYI